MQQQARIKKNISVLSVTDYIHGMTNIVDYTGSYLYTFRQKGFNELDALALSYLSYFRFPSRFTALRSNEGMKLRDLNLAEHYETAVLCQCRELGIGVAMIAIEGEIV